MAQHDGVIDNGTGNAVRTDINNALAAINSNNSGSSDPSTTYAYQFYADTGDNTLKIRNAANDGFVNVSITGGLGTENFGLAPITSPNFNTSIKLADNVKALFGTSDDFEIYHNNTNNILSTSNGNIELRHTVGGADEPLLKAYPNNAVELYYDNDRKISTVSNGIRVESGTGDCQLDVRADEDAVGVDAIVRVRTTNTSSDSYLMFGDSDDYYVGGLKYEHANDKLEFVANNAERGSVDNNGLWRFSNGFLLLDSIKGLFGSGSDLEIYHDGNSIIDSDSGYLKLTANSGDVYIQSDSDVHITSHNAGETMAKFTKDGAAELYHNNVKKAETVSGGFTVTGTCTATSFSGDGSNLTGIAAGGVGGNTGIDFNDNVAIRFGNSNDVSIDYDSTNDRAEIVTSDGASIEIDSDNDLICEADDDITLIAGDDLFIKHGTASSNESMITCNSDGSIQLYCDNIERLRTTNTGVDIFGALQNVGVGTAIAVLREEQSHAVNGGTFSSGADRVRVLNTEEHDGEAFCSLNTSTGEFTLPTGTYLIYFEALAFDVNNHRAKIVTDGGTDVIFGTNARSAAADSSMTASSGFGVVTNGNSEGYFLKHRCATTKTTSGFGQDMNFANDSGTDELEHYATVVIFRMD